MAFRIYTSMLRMPLLTLISENNCVFLKSKTKTDQKPAVKITPQYKLSSAFCEKVKIVRKKILRSKREIFRFPVF